ncbi:MAG TPA: YkgJ family cysteine cluster protein [Gemmataceae bacterium]
MATPRSVRVELKVLGERVAVEAPRPAGRVRIDEVLPFLRELDDRVIGVAVRRAEAGGGSVSCRKGCSACCRAQPVPVTPAEAYALWRLVEAMPEPRRSEVRRRFEANAGRLEEAGLRAFYLKRDREITADEARDIARNYFNLGLVCPFLEDDACSIYADRPFVCRQYLVTSPAELCANPFDNPVRPVPIPITPAKATLRTAEEMLGTPQYTVPLTLAPEYAEAHRDELERTHPAEELFRRAVGNLVERGAG